MKKTLAALGIVTYFAMGCVQLLACIKGIQVWFNLPWIVAAFIAFWISQGQLDFGTMPLGPIAVLMLFVLILRRTATPVFSSVPWT